jgi:hypothetical protein
VFVSSRFLVGLGVWLLGAATATTGSMIAVQELAQHLLDPQTLQLGATAMSTDHDSRGTGTDPPRAAAIGSSGPSSAGTLLVSGDGSVTARCGAGGAYLLFWSPDAGFRADNVNRGPIGAASVLFRSQDDSVVMQVTCSSGTPIAHVYQPGGDAGDGGDE